MPDQTPYYSGSDSSCGPVESTAATLDAPEALGRATDTYSSDSDKSSDPLPATGLPDEGFLTAEKSTTDSTRIPGASNGNLLTVQDSATEPSVENRLNEERLAYLRQFSSQVVALARNCIFEFGCESELDLFLRESLARNAMATREWLNQVFNDHFHDVSVIVGILRAIAHLEYQEVFPAGPTMAVAALAHDDVEVRECGIRAFENWESPDALVILESLRCEEPWLQDYLELVIADLKKGHRNGASRAEN
jgi:hypothetical protein